MTAAGLAPRVGPGRAAWIALRSRFAPKPVPESLRIEEIKDIKSMLAKKDFGQSYLVVTGEKGVGKTCLLRTVTSKTPGVIDMEALPGHSAEIVIKNALAQLTRIKFDFVPPFDSARRVIFWHRLFTLGRSPIVVINATERKVGQEYASLTSAVRILVDKYKLRVIVDGSPNSIDDTLLRTTRQRVFEIKPMTKDMVWEMIQLQDLFKRVKEAGLDDTVFAVLGGVPSKYDALWDDVEAGLQKGQDAREVIGRHLCGQISAAVELIRDSRGDDEESISKLTKLFSQAGVFTKGTLVANGLKRPTPDKVFRGVMQDGVHVLIPASNAIGIALRHNLSKEPSLSELEVLLKTERP